MMGELNPLKGVASARIGVVETVALGSDDSVHRIRLLIGSDESQ